MPHAQVSGKADLRSYWECFEPRVRRDEDRIVKLNQAYLAHGGRSVLVECNVVEGYLRQHFMAQLIEKNGTTLVRLFHGSHPEKTDGVRFCLGWIAAGLITQNPRCRWGSDTLGLSPHPFRPG